MHSVDDSADLRRLPRVSFPRPQEFFRDRVAFHPVHPQIFKAFERVIKKLILEDTKCSFVHECILTAKGNPVNRVEEQEKLDEKMKEYEVAFPLLFPTYSYWPSIICC